MRSILTITIMVMLLLTMPFGSSFAQTDTESDPWLDIANKAESSSWTFFGGAALDAGTKFRTGIAKKVSGNFWAYGNFNLGNKGAGEIRGAMIYGDRIFAGFLAGVGVDWSNVPEDGKSPMSYAHEAAGVLLGGRIATFKWNEKPASLKVLASVEYKTDLKKSEYADGATFNLGLAISI